MDATKPTSLRIPDEIIAFAEEIAKAKEWSRAKVLVRSIECGLPLVGDRTLKGYQQNHDQAENLIKGRGNGIHAGQEGAEGVEGVSEVKQGVDAGVAGKSSSRGSRKIADAKPNSQQGSKGNAEVVKWFPYSMCPHKYQNSFACEKDGGGCVR
jgi:hypothetical protein